MSKTPPEHIEKMDWRIQHLTWTTAPFTDPATGSVVPAGASVVPVALIHYRKERLGATIPNATALFLSLSHSFHGEARSLLRKCIADKDKFGKLPDAEVFTFYERMMGSVVFACTALEAFVNEQIPDAYVYVDSSDKRVTRQYNKEQIERNLSLDTKIGDVIPGAIGVPFPKGGKLWSNFIKLRDLRDRVIHMKTKDREFIGENADSIWNALLSDPLPETYVTVKRIMSHFLNAKGDLPRWFEKCSF
jgi:hypothetical protein